MNLEIIPANIKHVYFLAENMREQDKIFAEKQGKNPKIMLRQIFRQSIYSKTALIDGKVVAMWGLKGVLLGSTGYPWLLTSAEVLKYPFKVAKIYKTELDNMLNYFDKLVDWVIVDHIQSIRMLKLMGFKMQENIILENNTQFIKAEKRRV